MAYRNGEVPATALRSVAPGVQLVSATANAYKSLVLIGALDGIKITPAAGVGSGYRSIALQKLFYAAYKGDTKAAIQVGLNPDSRVAVAQPGYSTHGFGTRIDLLFGGSSLPNSGQLELAAENGWDREFGKDDPNHFKHDGVTGISGPSDENRNRILATWLNSLGLGKQTTTAEDGKHSTDPSTPQIYTWLIQTQGHKDGLYPTPLYKIDGKWGPRTAWLERYYWQKIWGS